MDLYDGRTPKIVERMHVYKITPNDGFVFKYASLELALPYICTWYNLTPPKAYPKGRLNGHIRLDIGQDALIAKLQELSGLKFEAENGVLILN